MQAPEPRSHHAGVRKVRNAPESPARLSSSVAVLSFLAAFSCNLLLPFAIAAQVACQTAGCLNSVPHSRVQVRNYFCSICKPSHPHATEASEEAGEPPPSPPSSSMFGRPDGCIDQLTFVERAAIVTLHQVGWTGRDIARELRCSENTVSLWWNRWQQTRSLEDSERSGRPRCTFGNTTHVSASTPLSMKISRRGWCCASWDCASTGGRCAAA